MDVDIGDPASSSVPGSLSFDENEDFKKYDDDHAVVIFVPVFGLAALPFLNGKHGCIRKPAKRSESKS